MIVFAFDPGETTGICTLIYSPETNEAEVVTNHIDLIHFNPFDVLTIMGEFFLRVVAEKLQPDLPVVMVVEDVVKTGRLNMDKFNQICAYDRSFCICRYFEDSEVTNAQFYVVTPEQRKHLGIKVPKDIKVSHEKDAFKQAVLGLHLSGVDIDNVTFITDH